MWDAENESSIKNVEVSLLIMPIAGGSWPQQLKNYLTAKATVD